MTNLKTISDETLLHRTKLLVKNEREILTEILHHLKEIERHRLFSSLKYGSLYDYAMKELDYTEDQAYRRIQAARLLKELPEIEEKINDGSLSLTHLSMAQTLFKREEKATEKTYTKQEKIEVLERLENTSKREAEKIAVSLSSTPIVPVERIRAISDEDFEFKYVGKEAHLNKVQRLKDLLSHKYPNLGLGELMDLLVDLGLEKFDKTNSKTQNLMEKTEAGKVEMANLATAPVKVKQPGTTTPTRGEDSFVNIHPPTQIEPATSGGKPSKTQIKRNVRRRDNDQCQICGSRYAIEIDHRFPKALGGGDTEENLRLLCRSCNQREAINIYGQRKMDMYFNT